MYSENYQGQGIERLEFFQISLQPLSASPRIPHQQQNLRRFFLCQNNLHYLSRFLRYLQWRVDSMLMSPRKKSRVPMSPTRSAWIIPKALMSS